MYYYILVYFWIEERLCEWSFPSLPVESWNMLYDDIEYIF